MVLVKKLSLRGWVVMLTKCGSTVLCKEVCWGRSLLVHSRSPSAAMWPLHYLKVKWSGKADGHYTDRVDCGVFLSKVPLAPLCSQWQYSLLVHSFLVMLLPVSVSQWEIKGVGESCAYWGPSRLCNGPQAVHVHLAPAKVLTPQQEL